ncbi:MAG: hypothetical protein WBQ19_14810 [Terriglobales bacterium]
MSKVSSVVATYHTHPEADQAVKELQRGGVDMHKLSIVGKGTIPMSRWWATTIPATA